QAAPVVAERVHERGLLAGQLRECGRVDRDALARLCQVDDLDRMTSALEPGCDPGDRPGGDQELPVDDVEESSVDHMRDDALVTATFEDSLLGDKQRDQEMFQRRVYAGPATLNAYHHRSLAARQGHTSRRG